MGKTTEKNSEKYALATEMAMFMARNLRNVGIDVVVTTDEHARKALENEKGDAEFSMRDIMNLSYTWNGEEVSMRGFAEQFMSEIKRKDRTMEDAERIARTFIEAVKADPEKAGMKMLKAEKMANAFRFKLPDGTVYSPEHPMAMSPEYQTQKRLWEIYEHVLGKETMREFIGLLSKNAPMSSEERRRYSELESRVNGSDYMQSRLEVPASKVNENRVKDIRNLIQYFEGNDDYTWTEKALIVKGAMSFGYSEKKEADSTRVEIKNISDNNSVSVPVIGGEAAAVVEGLRKGLNFKEALVQARIMLSKESKRSVESNFTGWKVYKQSDKEEDAVILNQDVAGTGWCTGGAVSTARSHLSGGDFHVYYEAGEPLIAIRTNNGRMAEPPRGAHEDQSCKPREEQIAFDYIRSGNGIIAGDDYIADIEDIRRVMSPNATPLDAFMMPEERRYENGEFGDDTKAWGTSVEQRIAELVPDKKEERWKLGLYYGNEIEYACKNGNAIAIKGNIYLYDSSSLTLSEGVTQVGDIELTGSASLTLPAGVTQVGNIHLEGSASLTLPAGVTKVGGIRLHGSSSLTLPEGVTQVGGIRLYDSSSLTLSEGVTQVGNIYLEGSASLTFPDCVTQMGNIILEGTSSLILPEGVTRVGNIELRDSTSLTLPEGVTQVGNIYLEGFTSLTLSEGVKQVESIKLFDSASFTFHEGVTRVGNIELHDSTSLTLPEGVTQVGAIHLSPGSSITFPDGFVLRNDMGGRMHYTSEKINEILSEHQKKTEFRIADGTIYGYQQGDTIYLTPAGINPNTPIHEYAHLWAKVYEKIQPDQWEAMKVELKGLPLWEEIASSRDYQHLSGDENRLAGEVLATVVGNKGEELLLEHAGQLINETGNPVAIKDAVQSFRDRLTNIAVEDVFKVEGMEHVGAVTLKVLKDFAEGKEFQLDQRQEENLAAMIKNAPEENIHDETQGKWSSFDSTLNSQRQLAPNGRPSNLSPEDWAFVRTPEFKDFFGDWENDPEHSSKILDENGEPLLVFHGSNNDFEKFDISKGGEVTGGGEWENKKTGEKIENDANKGIYFSSYYPQAVSYAMLAEYYKHNDVRNAFDGLYPCVNAFVNYDFKTRADFVSALKLVEPYSAAAASLLHLVEANPDRKILSDILPNMPETERGVLFEEVSAGRTRFSDICNQMRHGGLANMYNNVISQEESIRNLRTDIQRLRRNDETVKNIFGTFADHNIDIIAGGKRYAIIGFEDGRCRFLDEGYSVYLDKCTDEQIDDILNRIESYHQQFIQHANEEISSNLYSDNAHVYKCFLNIRDPFAHNYEGSAFPDNYKKTKYPTGYIAARQVRKALADGNDGVIYNHIVDPFYSNTYGVFSSDQIMIVGKTHGIHIDSKDELSIAPAHSTSEGKKLSLNDILDTKAEFALSYSSKHGQYDKIKSSDMPKYLINRLNAFTLSELEGGLLRVDALLSSMPSVNTIAKALSLHKELARENLLNEFSDVTPGEGMFNASTVEDMTLFSITMGRTGSNEALTYEDLMDADTKLNDKELEKLYLAFLNQYKAVLTYSLQRTKDRLTEATKQARTEAESIREGVRKGSLRARVVGQFMTVYKVFNQQRTEFPLDSEAAVNRDKVDKQIAFLKRNGVTSDLNSIVLNGFNYGLKGNFKAARNEGKSEFVIQSEASIFAQAEGQLRKILNDAVTTCNNKELQFINALPITYLNGNAFVGYPQAILRLAFEQNLARNHVFLPIVVDKEMMETLGLHVKDNAEPVHLLLGQNGSLVRKDFYFLPDTTFFEKYPDQATRLQANLAKLSNERQNDAERLKVLDALNDKYPSPVEESKANDIEDTLYRIAIESIYGVCASAWFDFNNENLQRLVTTSENDIAASYKENGISGTVFENALNSGSYVQQQLKEITKSESWATEKGLDIQEILESDEVSEERFESGLSEDEEFNDETSMEEEGEDYGDEI